MSDAPSRVQLRRTKGWRKPAGAIVVARPSKWGNPWRMSDWPAMRPAEARAMAVDRFREMLVERGAYQPDAPAHGYPSNDEIRAELAGHDLACWCPFAEPCHADVLLEIANS